MESNNRTSKFETQLVPIAEEATAAYEAAGGHLTHYSGFGKDPLENNATLRLRRETEFHLIYPKFDPLFHKLVNGDDTLFCSAICLLIQLTQSLMS